MFHCFFEQSGTFKNEFKKLGYEAEDYDILNDFGETDHVIDLFSEIRNAYDSKPSVFDKIFGGGYRHYTSVFPLYEIRGTNYFKFYRRGKTAKEMER